MNITSIFRGTVNQLTTGAGKAINSVVDFFSSLRSGITGLFNSSTPFRQATTEPSFIHHTSIGFLNNKDEPIKSSLKTIIGFLNECKDESNLIIVENKYSKVVDCVTTSNDEPYYNTLFEGQIHNTPSERHIYSLPFEENIYSLPFEDHIYSLPFEEDIYSLPFEEDIYSLPSEKNIYDEPPTESEIMKICSFLPKDKTKFNTI